MNNAQREEVQEETKAFLAAYKPVLSHVLGMVVKATIELGVFDALVTAGPSAELTAGEISRKLQASINEKGASMLDLMLEFLSTHSILTCSSTVDGDGHSWKRYGLTSTGRLMANRDDGLSFASLVLLFFHKDFMDTWHYLKEAVQEGVNPFMRAHGTTFYEYMEKNPGFSKIFHDAMENQSNLLTENVIDKYKDGLMQINELVDVGGGTGATLGNIVSKFPHIKGINFDLPHVISQALIIPGVQHIGGDMFDVIPSGGAILLKWVLHNWNDECCLAILRNCRRALPALGKVIVVEYILPETSEANDATADNFALSMTMMTLFDGAKERTEKEYRSLAKEACFSEFRIACKALKYFIMELIK